MTKVSRLPNLWLGQIDETFASDHDEVAGPWCFRDIEGLVPNLEDRNFSDPLDDTDELLAAGEKCRGIINALVPELSEKFNARHLTNYDPNFWRFLVAPWLISVVPAVYCRFVQLRALAARLYTRQLRVGVTKNTPTWQPTDSLDVWTRFLNHDAFDSWLSSKIVERIAPPSWQLVPVISIASPAPVRHEPKPLMRGMLRALFDMLRCRRVAGMGPLHAILFSAYLSLLPRKSGQPAALRTQECTMPDFVDPDFMEILRDVLDRLIPETLTTRFKILNAAAGRRRFRAGKLNLVGPVLFLNVREQFKLAHAAMHGEWIVCTQHGAEGYQKLPLQAAEMDYLQDAFLTWGWSRQGDMKGRFVPLPSPMYGPLKDKHHEQEQTLVLVAAGKRISSIRLQTTELRGRYAIESRRENRRFIESLQPDIRDRLAYRPYPESGRISMLAEDAYFGRHIPGLKFLGSEVSEPELFARLLRCRLAVVDHPVTTFSKALVANVPTIGIWDPCAWPMTEESVRYFEAFEKAGMVFSSGAAAGAAVSERWNNLHAWWYSEAVQNARLSFCNAFARTSPNWWRSWAVALNNLS